MEQDFLVMTSHDETRTPAWLRTSKDTTTAKCSTYRHRRLVIPTPLNNMMLIFCLIVTLAKTSISGPELVDSIVMPPPKILFTTPPLHGRDNLRPVLHSSETLGEDEPYKLTINERDGISVGINSRSAVTINLNKAIPEPITVVVKVNSGPNLIVFDVNETLTGTDHIPSPVTFKNETPSQYTVEYPANMFGDRLVHFHTTDFAGHAEIVCRVQKQPNNKSIVIDDSTAFTSVNIYRVWNLNVLIQIVGWIYFFAWSASFYFQVILNYRRKSVVGLNFDFLMLNLLGFACYSIYNLTLLFSYHVQQEYYKRYTYSRIPVEYNDLFFALHAFLITLVTVVQCFIYEVS
jgi:uncharacterized protein with PQ loop repeat